MICPSCGRELNDDVNFCYYCGQSFRGGSVPEIRSRNYQSVAPTNTGSSMRGYVEPDSSSIETDNAVRYDMQRARQMKETEDGKAMKPIHYVLYFSCLLIPLLWIVWLIITCVWAFGSKGTTERRNFARGMLLTMLLFLVIAFTYIAILVSKYGADGTIEKLTNGVYKSVDDYMNSVGK